MKSILIIDDHLLVRQGLRKLLAEEHRGLTFVEAKTAAEGLAAAVTQEWDLVTLDLTLPDKHGFYVLQEILQRHPAARVLVIGSGGSDRYATRAQQLGAAGFIDHRADRSEFVKALNNVLIGEKYFALSRFPTSGKVNVSEHSNLSPREYKVMLALAAGKRINQIALEMKVKAQTVSTYKQRILNKMHLESIADLVRYAMERQLF